MIKEQRNIIIFELSIIVLIGILTYVLLSKGISWENIQLVSVLIFIGIFLPLRVEAKQRGICLVNGKSVILLGVLAWILLDPLTLREKIEVFSPEDVLKVFLMIILFLIMVYIGYLIKWPPYFMRIFRKLDYKHAFNAQKLFRLTIVSFFLGFLPLIIWGGGLDNVIKVLTHAGRWRGSWGRAALGGWTDWLKTGLNYFNILAIQLTAFYSLFVKKNTILISLAALAVWIVFNSGTRNALAAVLLPAFLLYYLTLFHKRRKTRYWLFVLAYLLLSVLQLQLVIRDAPVGKSIKEVISESFAGIVKAKPMEHQRDYQFYNMVRLAEVVPSKAPYTGEFLLLRPLYHFVPRAIWKGKPVGASTAFEKALGVKGYTIAVSVIGDFYICQGWLGICIIGVVMGFLAKQFDSLVDISKHSPAILLLYSYGLIFLFVSIRGYQIVYEGWYVFVFMYLILKSIGKKARSSVSSPES